MATERVEPRPATDTIGSTMPLPDLSPEQRAAALEKAAAARLGKSDTQHVDLTNTQAKGRAA